MYTLTHCPECLRWVERETTRDRAGFIWEYCPHCGWLLTPPEPLDNPA